MSKRIFASILLTLMALTPLSATSMRELWLAALDSIFPYLDKSKRTELIELWDLRQKGTGNADAAGLNIELKNSLGGTTTLDTLTTDFVQVKLNKLTVVQMKLLSEDGDSTICLVKTLMVPEGDSQIDFYDLSWRLKRRVVPDWRNYVARPDTMSNDDFERVMRSIKLAFVKATLHADDNMVDVAIDVPLRPKEQKDDLSFILQRNVKTAIKNVK